MDKCPSHTSSGNQEVVTGPVTYIILFVKGYSSVHGGFIS